MLATFLATAFAATTPCESTPAPTSVATRPAVASDPVKAATAWLKLRRKGPIEIYRPISPEDACGGGCRMVRCPAVVRR